MKAKIEILGSIGILVLLMFSCQKETDLSDCEILNGNAKLKRILVYDTMSDTVPLKILEQYEYDELDRIFRVSVPKSIDTNLDSSLFSYDLYEYNSDNQLIKKFNYNANIYSPTGYVNLRNHIYTYSNDGKVIKKHMIWEII